MAEAVIHAPRGSRWTGWKIPVTTFDGVTINLVCKWWGFKSAKDAQMAVYDQLFNFRYMGDNSVRIEEAR